MTHVGEIVRRVRRSITRIFGGINGRLGALERRLSAQGRRIRELESEAGESLHSLEGTELKRREVESERQDLLSDGQLRVDLRSRYGATKWAAKLINEIIRKRDRAR